MFLLLLPYSASAEDRVVLTIGDTTERSGSRYNEDLGFWHYLEDLADVEIEYIYMTPEEYDSALSSGNLPDLVATRNNLSTIMEYGAAFNADPFLEEYVPNFLQGEARMTYEVFKQLESGKNEGFYFFPARIGYNGVGFDNVTSSRGYILRWDYYKELGYPPINNEDDYLKVLQQMHANHPFTEEGYPTYLYGTDSFSGYNQGTDHECAVRRHGVDRSDQRG